MKVYKLLRIKDGKLYPLFINRKEETQLGIWMDAECYPTKGFAVRKGWYCCYQTLAPHLKMELANGEKEYGLNVMQKIAKNMLEVKNMVAIGCWLIN